MCEHTFGDFARPSIRTVPPHAHAHRAVGQPPLRLHGRRHRVAGPCEDDKEGVALGVHLDAAVARERLSQDTACSASMSG